MTAVLTLLFSTDPNDFPIGAIKGPTTGRLTMLRPILWAINTPLSTAGRRVRHDVAAIFGV